MESQQHQQEGQSPVGPVNHSKQRITLLETTMANMTAHMTQLMALLQAQVTSTTNPTPPPSQTQESAPALVVVLVPIQAPPPIKKPSKPNFTHLANGQPHSCPDY